MKKAQKQEYLESFLALNCSINKQIEQLSCLRSKATGISQHNKERVRNTKVINKLELIVEEIILMQNKINADIDRYVDMRIELENKFACMTDRRLSLLLKYRYIDGLNWDKICEKLIISEKSKQIFALHNKALEMLPI